MKFKIDENLHTETASFLTREGHDAITVKAQGLRGSPDSDIARICRDENRILITLDKDFSDIRTYPPADYPGIIVLRLYSQSRTNVLEVFRQLLRWFGQYPLEGHLWIVEEGDIRIRGPNT